MCKKVKEATAFYAVRVNEPLLWKFSSFCSVQCDQMLKLKVAKNIQKLLQKGATVVLT